MTRSDIKAGRAFVELAVNSAPLQQGLRDAQRHLMRYASAAAVIGGATYALQQFRQQGDALKDMATRTGASVEALSALKFAALQSGTSIDAIEKAIVKLSKTMESARRGGKGAQESLAQLGLTAAELARLSVGDRFIEIATRISQIEDPGRRAALAMEVLGKSATELLPLMESGAKGIAELTAEAERLGVVMSTEDAEAAAKLDDSINRLTTQFNALTLATGRFVSDVGLLGLLEKITAEFRKMANEARVGWKAALAGGDWEGMKRNTERQMAAAVEMRRKAAERLALDQAAGMSPDDAGASPAGDTDDAQRQRWRSRFDELSNLPNRQKTLESERERQSLAGRLGLQFGEAYVPPPAEGATPAAGRGDSWLERAARAGGPAVDQAMWDVDPTEGRKAFLGQMRPGGSVGTFSAAAVGSLGGGSQVDRISRATEESAKLLAEANRSSVRVERLLAAFADVGLTWGQ